MRGSGAACVGGLCRTSMMRLPCAAVAASGAAFVDDRCVSVPLHHALAMYEAPLLTRGVVERKASTEA